MAEKDKSDKALQEYPDVFADIFNALVFKGEKILEPDQLKQIEGESISSPDERELKQLFRDVLMEHIKTGTRYLILGLENQSDVDNTMPLRGMGMDYAAYEKQVRHLMAANRAEDRDAGARKLHKDQKLIPVITLILYFGTYNWLGPKRLCDMLDMPSEIEYPGISEYIHDYGMNLVVLKNLSEEEEERFHSDFKYLVKYLRNYKDPEKVVEVYREEFEDMTHPKETMGAMAAMTKDERYLTVGAERKKEEDSMSCVVLDYVEAKAEARGEAIGGVRMLIETCQEFGVSWEETLDRVIHKCRLEEEDAMKYMDEFWVCQ